MLKKIALWLAVVVGSLTVLLVAVGIWVSSLLASDTPREQLQTALPTDLTYLNNGVKEQRGRILAVVTSAGSSAIKGKNLGYELTELSRAYYVLQANGFEVDVASTEGGKPKMVIDTDDMGQHDYAFLNDAIAQTKITNTIPINQVSASQYDAIYFVGGKGALFDFPNNTAIQTLVREMYQQGKVIAAICHGPAALVNVQLTKGDFLIADKQVTSFTNEEELFITPNAAKVFPFLLESELKQRGARYYAGPLYLNNIITDGKLITGQNPWSVWRTAETIISTLGYTPIKREITGQERAVNILMAYKEGGSKAASTLLLAAPVSCSSCVDRNLIAMHALVAVMQGKVGKAIDLLGLVRQAKKHTDAK